jgi:hypothetical protein
MRNITRSLVVGLTVLILPAAALAQNTGAISGEVQDSTGGVLPGVTVEASSPALIEGSRVVVTDAQGRYSIISLRPGLYSVTFSLPGFGTVIRDGIEMTAQFTANVNVNLSVGTLEETVTVSGAAPTVDIQSTVTREVMTKEEIDAVPMIKNWSGIGILVPGMTTVTPDVGGSAGEEQNYLAVHGGSYTDTIRTMDGMTFSNFACDYSCTGVSSNDAMTEELSYEYAANSAEVGTGGVRVNIIPKEGGNQLSGSAFFSFTGEEMVDDNLTQELIDLGVNSSERVDRLYDASAAIGGPLVRDRLWFFSAFRFFGNRNLSSDTFWEANPFDTVADKDLSRPGIDNQWNSSNNIRLTWQMNQTNKLSVYYDIQPRCQCHWLIGATRTPEASAFQRLPKNYHSTISYTSTISSRLLFEAGASIMNEDWTLDPQPGASGGDIDSGAPIFPSGPFAGIPTSFGYGHTERNTGINFRAYNNTHSRNDSPVRAYRAALSYVTGSHTTKFGMDLIEGPYTRTIFHSSGLDTHLEFRGGVPDRIRVYTTPYTERTRLNADLGAYVQDAWTVNQMTLNAGVRVEYLNAKVLPQTTAGGTWLGARSFDGISDVPNWWDVSPRLGLVYDLRGDGRTAIKTSLSRYVDNDNIDAAEDNNPYRTIVNNTRRTWSDANGDFIPQESELGLLQNANFGTTVISREFDPALNEGFGVRRGNWEVSAGVTHELLSGVSAEVAYFRRTQFNLREDDNRAVVPGDYDEFCVTGPSDPRLPNGGGERICGLFDINPSKQGLSDRYTTNTSNLGNNTVYWQGVDFNLNARLAGGAFLNGGFSTGRASVDSCGIVDSPENRFCDLPTSVSATGGGVFTTQVKLSGAYTLPWQDLQFSAAYQNVPGAEVRALWFLNAGIPGLLDPANDQGTGGLGRCLANGCRATKTVELIPRTSQFGERLNQLDIRLTKSLDIQGSRVRLMFDLYNAFNQAWPISNNVTFGGGTSAGSSWNVPRDILPARFFKLGAGLDW